MNDKIRELHDMIIGYLECALWVDSEEGKEEIYTADNLAAECYGKAGVDCFYFLDAATKRGINVGDYTMLGHDLWLTRNGHGSGFWDGDWQENDGEILTELTGNMFKEVDLYVGDDGKIYFN